MKVHNYTKVNNYVLGHHSHHIFPFTSSSLPATCFQFKILVPCSPSFRLQQITSDWLFFSHQVLHNTFQEHTFLMNGLIQGVKVRNHHSASFCYASLNAKSCHIDYWILWPWNAVKLHDCTTVFVLVCPWTVLKYPYNVHHSSNRTLNNQTYIVIITGSWWSEFSALTNLRGANFSYQYECTFKDIIV